VLIALAIGDQRAIETVDWETFTRTGVGHLMSISGLHVTMVAGLFAAFVAALWRRSARLVLRLPVRKAAAGVTLVRPNRIDEVLPLADVVIITAPATTARKLFDEAARSFAAAATPCA
jgi:hypothetical protein